MKIRIQLLLFLFLLFAECSFSQSLFNKGFISGVATLNLMATQYPTGDYFLYGGNGLAEGGFFGKLDSNGDLLWANQLYYYPSYSGAVSSSIVFDADSNQLVIAMQGEYPNKGSMIKMDTSGTIIWEIDLDLPVTNVVRSTDSNYVFLGRRNVAGAATDFDFFLFKVSQTGSVIFANHYQYFSGYNMADKMTYDLVQHPNGNLYALVTVSSYLYVICFSPTGIVLWNKKYFDCTALQNYIIDHELWKLLIMPDSTLLVCGRAFSQLASINLKAFKIDVQGNVLWSKEYPGPASTGLVNAFLNHDSTVTLFGDIAISTHPMVYNKHVFLKIDQNGTLLNTFEVNDPQGAVYPLWAEKNIDSTCLLIQLSSIDSLNGIDTTQVIKLDSQFNSNCTTDSLLNYSEIIDSISVLDSFPLMILPATYSTASLGLTIVPKNITRFNFCDINPIVEQVNIENFKLFPNPANDYFTISFERKIKNGNVEILNSLGEIIFKVTIYSETNIKINLPDISDGIYFVKVFDGERNFGKKLIVEQN